MKLKSEAFYHFAEQILNLLEVAKQIDQEHLEFFIKDVEKFGDMPNVKVFNYNSLSSEEILSLINSQDKTILGWCHSEYFSLIREGFK